MEERIKTLRKTLGLTQDEFAKRIGLARNSVANYEIGRREPTNAIILSICKEFKVNEDWLRTGEGKMLRENSMEDEAAYYVGELLKEYNDNPFYDMIIDMMKTYRELDEKSKKVIQESMRKLQKNIKAREAKSSPAPPDI